MGGGTRDSSKIFYGGLGGYKNVIKTRLQCRYTLPESHQEHPEQKVSQTYSPCHNKGIYWETCP